MREEVGSSRLEICSLTAQVSCCHRIELSVDVLT